MSFIELKKELFETSTITLKPEVHFVSSSLGEYPATGSAYVAPIRSKCIKDLVSKNISEVNRDKKVNPFNLVDFDIFDIMSKVNNSIRSNYSAFAAGINIDSVMELYFNAVNNAPKDIRYSKFLDMYRFDSPLKFNICHTIKRNINNVLQPYYSHRYPNSGLHYTNFNCLNFFTNDSVPDDSCLIYPNLSDVYTPPKGFCLDFWINPKYDNKIPASEYTAGTIFHMSSSIAVSLVSGSNLDEFNLVDDFKILLQLSHSADSNPSNVNLASPNATSDLIFTSSFSLNKNTWHHISINWDPSVDNSTGSISTDGNLDNFYIQSSSISTTGNNAVFIGNYFDSINADSQKFFNATKAAAQGLTQLTAITTEPANQSGILSNPLNAEIHDIKLFNRALSKYEIETIVTGGINQIISTKAGCEISNKSLYDDLLFFVPPFFYPETRAREVIVTPFQTIATSTNDPFNTAYSFGVGGKIINLENFVKEFKQGEFPRLQSLTGSVMNAIVENITADEFVYNTGSLVKRNLTILPCDNGLFYPDYYPISISTQYESTSYVNNGTHYDYSRISLDNLIPSSSLFPGLVFQGGSIFDEVVGSSPKNPGVAPGSVLTIAQRTRDRSSNETTIFDISNLYYGNRIVENTFEVIDLNLTGSSDTISIKIKDNGEGSLYRADCRSKHATWNNIGDIYYHEGIVNIKTPHLPYFCKDESDIKFKGEQNIHIMMLNVPCEKGMLNSSSNSSYIALPPTDNVNDRDLSTVFLTTVNIHDNNFNIIMKANFAQPIVKTEEDEFIVRLKQDF